MRMISRVLAVTVTAAVLTGCLREEVSHTIYLGPSGVIWSAIERDIRSDERLPADRLREEHDFELAAGAGTHLIAKALQRLGGRSVTTTWLRRDRPFSVMTEARFADSQELVRAVLRDAETQGDVTLLADGCQTKLTIRVNLESGPESHGDHAVDALFTDLARYRFVLTEGRFISADGFVIEDDGAAAIPDETKSPADGILTLALTWANEGCNSR